MYFLGDGVSDERRVLGSPLNKILEIFLVLQIFLSIQNIDLLTTLYKITIVERLQVFSYQLRDAQKDVNGRED